MAIITIYDAILAFSGINFLKSEIKKFEHVKTAIVAKPIPIPFETVVETPNVGQVPRTSTKTGFSSIIFLKNAFII